MFGSMYLKELAYEFGRQNLYRKHLYQRAYGVHHRDQLGTHHFILCLASANRTIYKYCAASNYSSDIQPRRLSPSLESQDTHVAEFMPAPHEPAQTRALTNEASGQEIPSISKPKESRQEARATCVYLACTRLPTYLGTLLMLWTLPFFSTLKPFSINCDCHLALNHTKHTGADSIHRLQITRTQAITCLRRDGSYVD